MSSVTGLGENIVATILGTEGAIHINGTSLSVESTGDQELQSFEIPEDESRGCLADEGFITAIHGADKPALTDFETGVRYMEFAYALWRSMQEGVTVSLPSGEHE